MAINLYKKVKDVVDIIPNDRTKTVVLERFGLIDGEPKTLQAIGDKYGITRERVRQIENSGYVILNDKKINAELLPIYDLLESYLKEHGNLRREDRIAKDVLSTANIKVATDEEKFVEPALQFCMTLGKPFIRVGETNDFYNIWTLDVDSLKKASKIINLLISHFKTTGKVISKNELDKILKNDPSSTKAIHSYVDATKHIEENHFGEVGLANWPEVSPRGIRDKAYILIKRSGKPVHFTEVAKLIGENFANGNVNTQTVHNELIKDSRFVLVGRGLYALSEWGYEAGTVRDILSKLIEQSGPLSKDQILEQLRKIRFVKDNTILVNLQNRKHFVRLEDGRYSRA